MTSFDGMKVPPAVAGHVAAAMLSSYAVDRAAESRPALHVSSLQM